jgi:hypothetical protein
LLKIGLKNKGRIYETFFLDVFIGFDSGIRPFGHGAGRGDDHGRPRGGSGG